VRACLLNSSELSADESRTPAGPCGSNTLVGLPYALFPVSATVRKALRDQENGLKCRIFASQGKNQS
jgi:hypothetical protein